MVDVLAHVLVGYALGTALSVRYEWMRPAHVTLVMIGALSPDFVKVSLFVPEGVIGAALGVPFAWTPLQELGGNLLVLLLGTLCVAAGLRRRAFSLLVAGALTHHVLDSLLLTASGHGYALFWPLSSYRPPSPGLYLSSDLWPLFAALVLAGLAWFSRSRLDREAGPE